MILNVNPCQAFFVQHAQTDAKAAELVKTGKALELEHLSASEHSPGPVEDAEFVLRLVVNPIHVNPADGSLKPSLMSDVKSRGGSVQRLAHVSREAVIETGRAHAEEKNASASDHAQARSVYGTVKLPVQRIREVIVTNNGRAFGVFDTAKKTDPSHADVFLIVPEGQGARSARIQLMILANEGFQTT